MSAQRRRAFSWQYILFLAFAYLFFAAPAEANFLDYKVVISDSAPSTTANHTAVFRTTKLIEPGENIVFRPDPGSFSIPAVKFSTSTGTSSPPTPDTFSINNVELLVNSGSGYVRRNTATTSSAVNDGVTITSGTSGNVTITLNSSVGIPADSYVQFLIGNHTSLSTSTDTSITNPGATTTFPIYLSKTGASAVEVRPWVAIVDAVGVGPVDTTETIPPFRFDGAPTTTLPGTSVIVEVSLYTDEFAVCKYSTVASTTYASMGGVFDVTGVIFHSFETAVSPDTGYSFFVKCSDDEGNENITDYEISFSVLPPPSGTPGNVGDDPGSGDGDSETGGTGDSGSGSGSSSGETDGSSSSNGSSGGGGGGGTGDDSTSTAGGGFESDDAAYPSGDGRVIINGYAFPNSNVFALVDGSIAESARANSSGKYAITIDEIARGVYTFGVYGVDKDGIKSSTFSTTFTVTGSRSSSLSNVNVMPSIAVDPDPVDPGQTLTISGYTIPDAVVTIENQNDKTSASLKSFETTSEGDGSWSIEVSTDSFLTGTYKTRARGETSEISTNFSDYTYYGVGESADLPLNADLNRDGSVNLIDFSILLFWWGSDGGDSDPPADINRDGTVSLTDFSILLFQWTG